MIFIANKTREIEKKNNNLSLKISKISEDIKINEIELIAHKNSTYLKKLYSLYFSKLKPSESPNVVSIKEFSKQNKNIQLVNTNN